MSKKIFTLIHGEDIHTSPATKVIDSEAFSEMLTAEEMLQKVKEDADRYIKEVTEEGEKIKEQAQKEGFETGFKKWWAKVSELETKIESVHDEVHALIIPVALQAAKKIVGREMELKKDTIVDIVSNKLKAVAQHKKIKIFVNREDLKYLEEKKSDLKAMFEQLEVLSLIEKNDITPGGCIIETDGGIINAQIENQWMVIEGAFEKFMKSHIEDAPVDLDEEES